MVRGLLNREPRERREKKRGRRPHAVDRRPSIQIRNRKSQIITRKRRFRGVATRDPAFGPDILTPLEVLGLDRFAESAMIIKARIKTKPIKQWNVGREFNRRLKQKFDAQNIEIPFPHVTLYIGQDKTGRTAPIPVTITERPEPGGGRRRGAGRQNRGA